MVCAYTYIPKFGIKKLTVLGYDFDSKKFYT